VHTQHICTCVFVLVQHAQSSVIDPNVLMCVYTLVGKMSSHNWCIYCGCTHRPLDPSALCLCFVYSCCLSDGLVKCFVLTHIIDFRCLVLVYCFAVLVWWLCVCVGLCSAFVAALLLLVCDALFDLPCACFMLSVQSRYFA